MVFAGVAYIRPDAMDQVMEAVEAFLPKVRAETGTLEYVIYRGIENPNMIAFFEKYEDEEARAAHWASEEFKVLQAALGPCVDGQPIMGVVEEIASAR